MADRTHLPTTRPERRAASGSGTGSGSGTRSGASAADGAARPGASRPADARHHHHGDPVPTPYLELDRAGWSRLRASTPLTLDDDDLARLRGLGEPVDLDEVRDVYLPLSRLLNLYVRAVQGLHGTVSAFVGEPPAPTPFLIGVAGSVAVGKSTTARLLRELLARWPDHPRVELVTTDGFLYPNAELERRGLLNRKGFPESYDQRALLRFVATVKTGAAEVSAPVYSHLAYDVLPDEHVVVHRPDILIVEGLNVLQPAPVHPDGRPRLSVFDHFDFSVYVDARSDDVRSWYVSRFLALRDGAFQDPSSYFHRYAELDDDAARTRALELWHGINEPNLVENVRPTRGRATLVLQKGPDHAVQRVRLRKL